MGYKRSLFAGFVSFALYLSAIFSVFAPLPILVVLVRDGVRFGVLAGVVGIIGSLLFEFFVVSGEVAKWMTMHFLFLAFLGVIWGVGVLKRWSIVNLCKVTFICSLVLGFSVNYLFHGEILGMLNTMMDTIFKSNPDLFKGLDQNDISLFVFHYLPAFISISSLIGLILNLYFARKFCPECFVENQMIHALRLPDWVIWFLILSGGLYFADTYFIKNEIVRRASLISLILFLGIYFLQGLAVVIFYMKAVSSRFFKWFFLIGFIVFAQFMGLFLTGIGLIDNWVDFRKRILLKAAKS